MAIDWDAVSDVDAAKWTASLFIDALDCFIGRLPGFGIVWDAGISAVCSMMWGRFSWHNLWEYADISEQVDGFIPTASLIAWKELGHRYPLREKTAEAIDVTPPEESV